MEILPAFVVLNAHGTAVGVTWRTKDNLWRAKATEDNSVTLNHTKELAADYLEFRYRVTHGQT